MTLKYKIMLKVACSLLALGVFLPKLSISAPRRISALLVNLGDVGQIKMVAGNVTSIIIPGNVTGVRLGNPSVMTYVVPENPKNEVVIWLKSTLQRPTNISIISGNDRIFFDIIPSTNQHQDLVKVLGSYGEPSLTTSNLKLIDSSSFGVERSSTDIANASHTAQTAFEQGESHSHNLGQRPFSKNQVRYSK